MVDDGRVVVVDPDVVEVDGCDVVVEEQNGAAQLIVVVVVKNAAVVDDAKDVVDAIGSSFASPTHRMMWLIDLSPSDPPPCPPGSEIPFLFTSAKTPVPGSGL